MVGFPLPRGPHKRELEDVSAEMEGFCKISSSEVVDETKENKKDAKRCHRT